MEDAWAIEDALPGDEGEAVKLKCQECGKERGEKCGGKEGGEGLWLRATNHIGFTTVKNVMCK